ncbi:hypothetical protein GJU41_11755 [Bacillus idriensis]|uniref:Uncharacterized protein n=1 Tax=Metabacillus idriensis TaxID=324768 RepID=A0A6I2MBF4_9BACI|nr:hypothetical protein [Metabacillus idriensis]MRX54647.1 hypothetical protein [Metabacillus idriensis]
MKFDVQTEELAKALAEAAKEAVNFGLSTEEVAALAVILANKEANE